MEGVEKTTGGMHAENNPSNIEPIIHNDFDSGIKRKRMAIENAGITSK